MTIQSNINSAEVASQRQFSWPLALVILILGIVLGVFASNLTALANKTEVAAVPEPISREVPARPNLLELEKQTIGADTARAQAAEAARYNSLGLFYAAGNEQPALAAETARYTGLADHYKADRQTALAAETARYEGLTEYYDSHSLAWPPRPVQFHSAGNTEMNLNPHVPHSGMVNADSDRGLMDFFAAEAINEPHSLAWPSRPTQFHNAGNTEMNLGPQAVHQPGRVNADSDLGLMDFSTAESVNEPHSLAWPPRPSHFFLAKNGEMSDPNADIGLME